MSRAPDTINSNTKYGTKQNRDIEFVYLKTSLTAISDTTQSKKLHSTRVYAPFHVFGHTSPVLASASSSSSAPASVDEVVTGSMLGSRLKSSFICRSTPCSQTADTPRALPPATAGRNSIPCICSIPCRSVPPEARRWSAAHPHHCTR